jgi:hypothetical protein
MSELGFHFWSAMIDWERETFPGMKNNLFFCHCSDQEGKLSRAEEYFLFKKQATKINRRAVTVLKRSQEENE